MNGEGLKYLVDSCLLSGIILSVGSIVVGVLLGKISATYQNRKGVKKWRA